MSLADMRKKVEKRAILQALRKAGGSLRGAARILGCSEGALRAMAKRGGYGSEVAELRNTLRNSA